MILYNCTSLDDIEDEDSDDESDDAGADADRAMAAMLQGLPAKYRQSYIDSDAQIVLGRSVNRQRLHVALLIRFVSSHLSERSFLHMLLNLRRGRASVGRKRQVVQRDYLRLCEHLFHILQAASDSTKVTDARASEGADTSGSGLDLAANADGASGEETLDIQTLA